MKTVPENLSGFQGSERALPDFFLAFCIGGVMGDGLVEEFCMLHILFDMHQEIFHLFFGKLSIPTKSIDEIAEHKGDREFMAGADGAEAD